MENRKLILCIVGLPGAGKSTVAKMIARNFSACQFRSGDIIREEIRKRGLRYTKENDEKMSEWFHAGREHLIIGRLSKKMKFCARKILVVDGFFAPEEISMLNKIGKTVLIAVTAPSAVRYRRQLLRRRFINQTKEYFVERDRREIKEGLGKLIKKAQYAIPSKSGKRDLEKNVITLVNKILKKEKLD